MRGPSWRGAAGLGGSPGSSGGGAEQAGAEHAQQHPAGQGHRGGLSMDLRSALGQGRTLSRPAPTEAAVPQLGPQLPPRLTQQPWHLLYSTGRDGFSLRTLYRSGARPDSPALLLIRDTEAQVFRWTGRNDFFVNGDVNLLMVGGGSGRFGLWLDGDLHRGGSQRCETFDNEILSQREEFCIQDLEMWGLA
ncbi:TLD domain-containing protein 2 isoform X3 [Zonotrichia leucophrys gambelii]|uniref:TLD domain-containing protein 2 isoform X3 n=1 Tax=Zonotrichia leucophrys gambelii TaxID=257770 RepID=UPI00314074BA